MKDIILHSTPVEEIRGIIRDEMRQVFKEFHESGHKPASDTGQYRTRKQTANQLHITLPTLRNWTKTGRIKGYKIARRVLYKPEDIDSALREQPKNIRK